MLMSSEVRLVRICRKMSKLFFVGCLLWVATPLYACTIPPDDSRALPVEILLDAKSAAVVVFEKERVVPGGVEFSGRVKKLLWGSASDVSKVIYPMNDTSLYKGWLESGVRHDSPDFWTGKTANTGYGRDCKLVPNVKLGVPYLFLRINGMSRYSLEPIQGPEDSWHKLAVRFARKKQ